MMAHTSDIEELTWDSFSDQFKAGNTLGMGAFTQAYKVQLRGEAVVLLRDIAYINSRHGAKWTELVGLHKAISDSSYVVRLLAVVLTPVPCRIVEYMDGGSLADFIGKHTNDGGLDFSVVRSLARDVIKGLQHIHSLSIIHCDINPTNILLTTSGKRMHAKIGGFGVACHKESNPGLNGTILYMAPEVLATEESDSDAYDEKVDVFSFGLTLYEMLHPELFQTGWKSQSLANTAGKIFRGERPAFPTDSAVYPVEVKEFVAECWAQDPTQRPSATQALAKLKAIQ